MVPSLQAMEEVTNFDFSGIETLTQEQLDNEIFPGASILIKLGDEVLYEESFGHSYLYDMGTKLVNPLVTTNDTIYDLASVTKVTATTQAAMILVYCGELDLDKPVSEYWPGFGENGKDQVTARDLLTHTSGLTPWEATFLYGDTRAQEKTYIENLSLEYPTGSKYAYSDFSFMSLAFLVEAITNQPIEVFLEQNLYGPLGMTDTMYTPLEHNVDVKRIAATSWGNPYEWRMSNEAEYPGYGYDTSKDAEAFLAFDGWREYTLVGEVNDGNAGMANEGIAGHAGLFSTTHDLSVLADLMIQGGTLNDVTIYDQATIDTFTAADATRFGRGLGWQVGGARENSGYVGKYATEDVYSHAGFTGTQFIVDGAYGFSVSILTNKQNSGHTDGKYKTPYAYSRTIMNMVYEQIYANEDALREALTNIKPIQNNNFDVHEYATYVEAVEKANTLALDEMNYPALKETLDEIRNLENDLTPLDFTALDKILKDISEFDAQQYTKDSWENLMKVYGEVEVVYDTLDTHAGIANAVTLLQTDVENLKAVEKETPETPTTGNNTGTSELPKTGEKVLEKLVGSTLLLVLGAVVFIWRKRTA